MQTPIEIQIWSDLTCPWCFIGKTRLAKAITTFEIDPQSPPVNVVYRSFRIAPSVPTDFAGSTDDYLRDFEGMPAGQVAPVLEHVTAAGQREGIDYDFAKVQYTNSGLAHQLVQYAKTLGLQSAMVDRIYTAFFTDGLNIGGVDVLADLADEVGINRADAVEALTSGEFAHAVDDDETTGKNLGISGVPFYVIDNKFGVAGAQETDAFVGILQQIASEAKQ